ncbi:MAG TPA: LacI family DNA-binding transcriptional regulator [Rhodothermales bacterium]|nr:LacI family DNA-binding transcriptional regulator [Rhodothermales bacterium]
MAERNGNPTIKDVAKHCGVSIATVSAVLNRAAWVPAETRARIQQAIEQIGYRPNRLARSLKTRQSYSVGVIVSDITNPFFNDIVRNLSHVLYQHDRNLILCDSDHRFDLGASNFHMLLEKQVDAIVLIGDSVSAEELGAYLLRPQPVPVVAIERDYELDGVNKLLIDSERSAFEATQHLVEQGYDRIGMISGPQRGPGSGSYGQMQFERGYRRALEAAGLPYQDVLVAEGDFRYGGGQQAMRRLLALHTPPQAIFAANDMMALGAIQVAHEQRLHIPEDIAVVGYDDIPMAAQTLPPLTTLAVPRWEIAEAAADVLLAQLKDPSTHPPVRRMFTASLVVRASSVLPQAAAADGTPA